MAGIQITCPHCGSTLNLGQNVQAGAALQCLVCNRSFKVRAAAAAAPPAPAAAAPPGNASAPASPAAARTAEPARTSPAPATTMQRRKVARPAKAVETARSGSAGRALGGLVLVAIAMVMLVGIGYLLWTNVLADRIGRNAKDPPPPVVALRPDDGNKPRADAPAGAAKDAVPPAKDLSGSPAKDTGGGKASDAGLTKKKADAPATDGADDIGSLPRKENEKKAPVITEPKSKPDDDREKKDDKPPPTVEIVIPPTPSAPGVDAKRIDAAIARGVKFLRDRQQIDGSWGDTKGHTIGLAALCGLALLECNVPPGDPSIQRIAQLVRGRSVAGNTKGYDVSVAILFLDKLGDAKDKELIKSLGLQLIAAQNESGGWTYESPALTAKQAHQYDEELRNHWPWSAAAPRPAGFASSSVAAKPEAPNKSDKKNDPDKAPGPTINLGDLPLQQLYWNKDRTAGGPRAFGDNSNTQFALLGLWAARRHEVPAECSLLFGYYRFQATQKEDGTWTYYGPSPVEGSPTMTCAGLLGLAIGSGVLPNNAKGKDPTIERGLNALSQYIGHPETNADARPQMQNMYFLWSVERVGVLFDLKTIGGKDWYGWGAQILLANQHGDGHWAGVNYIGQTDIVDTCFALLFLKRANLAPDLTENLRLRMVIRDPGAK